MDIAQLYDAALAAQKSGQDAEAERLYRQILEQASPPEVLVNLGNLLARQTRRDEALALYDRALAARPDFLEGLFNRAGVLLELKRPRQYDTRRRRIRHPIPDRNLVLCPVPHRRLRPIRFRRLVPSHSKTGSACSGDRRCYSP